MADFQMIETNGIRLRVAIAGPEDGPLVILVHGFPESWYSWRHQIEALSQAGYRVAAPDVRGYGGSDQPQEIAAYAMTEMAADLVGIADALSEGTAVLVGHDWGAPIVYNAALLHPDKFHAVAGLSIPHAPVGKFTILDLTKRAFIDKDLFFYLHYFQEPGRAEEEFSADVAYTIRAFYYGWSGDAPDRFHRAKPAASRMFDQIGAIPDQMPDWLTLEDEAYYIAEFERSGWTGALHRYRNFEHDRETLAALPSQIIQQPALFIGGDRDPALIMFAGDVEARIRPNFADLRGVHMLEDCGHWIQQEEPTQVNAILLAWLDGLSMGLKQI